MTDRLLTALTDLLGERAVLTDPADVAPYVVDWRGAHSGAAAGVLRPGSTAEVAAAVRLCRGAGVALVPQGGNTGLCGGAVPDSSGDQLVLSLGRMRRIREVDPVNDTITVESGVALATVQESAESVGRLFPLSMGSEGSCTIGGNLATNAGGTAVVRYGMMRDLTLGLEVVLPDGRVWDGLRALRKDNTGYDLKQLFIGAEGTLGIITAAVLELFPATPRRATAWVALRDLSAAVDLLGLLHEHSGERLTTWELMSRQALDLVLAHAPGSRDPLTAQTPWFGLVELAGPDTATDLDGALEQALGQAFEHDDSFVRRAAELSRAIYDSVAESGGSISAEHGLGTSKRDAAASYKDPVELDLMRSLKNALDPAGLMNPGKALPLAGRA